MCAAPLLVAPLLADQRRFDDNASRSVSIPMPAEYVFIDEWDVRAPIDAVFEALADARTYPQWWKPVYLKVNCDGPPAVGRVSEEYFKGRLPYRLRIASEIVRLDRPGSSRSRPAAISPAVACGR